MHQLKEPAQPWKRWEKNALKDDAGGVYIDHVHILFQSVDIITPVCDDPELFAEIAVANALSDIYVRGARPLSALHILSYPPSTVPTETIVKLLNRAYEKLAAAGALSLGGHTLKGNDFRYGLAVTGIASLHQAVPLELPDTFPELSLFLTKPLGTGVLVEAYKNDMLSVREYESALHYMKQLNAYSPVGQNYRVIAATDITGYGFLIHLLQLIGTKNVKIQLQWSSFPVYAPSWKIWKAGISTGAGKKNTAYIEKHFSWISLKLLPEPVRFAFTDPQTSGGLLLALPADQEKAFRYDLSSKGFSLWKIGSLYQNDTPSFELINAENEPYFIDHV